MRSLLLRVLLRVVQQEGQVEQGPGSISIAPVMSSIDTVGRSPNLYIYDTEHFNRCDV
jgi:hypothetical protein